jgi:hypothetical protein
MSMPFPEDPAAGGFPDQMPLPGGGPMGPEPMGAPMGGPMGPEMGGQEAAGDPVEMAHDILNSLEQIRQVEPDEEDLLLLEKARTIIQQYIAAQQKVQDAAMGGGDAARFMRKARP